MVKKYKVVILPQAKTSLKEITEYLRRTASDSAAKKVHSPLIKYHYKSLVLHHENQSSNINCLR